VDREDIFTLCFFEEAYHKALGYLGSHSGRDGDKVAHVGMTPVFADDTTYFAEAKLVLVCRKLYQAPIKEEFFLDKSVVEDCYPNRDFHDLYIGSIEKVLIAE
jgi:flavin reductase (DIM6/NTAB) family NADH-FMN oxidoreductase RutF